MRATAIEDTAGAGCLLVGGGKSRKERPVSSSLELSVHMCASISRSAAPREWPAYSSKESSLLSSDGSPQLASAFKRHVAG